MRPGPRFQLNVRHHRNEETAIMAGSARCPRTRNWGQFLKARSFRMAVAAAAFFSLTLSRSDLSGQTSAPLALDPKKAITQYHHDVWNLDEGLPQSAVQALAQTPDGYLWIGLEEGLVRFDGVRFTLFFKGNTPAFTHNNIFAILVAKDSSLWVGTQGGGLIRFKAGEFQAYTSAQGLSNDFVNALCEDRQGKLWIGTNNGLNCLQDGKFSRYMTRQGLSHNAVLSIYEDSKNDLWIGTDGGGLNRLREEKFTAHTTQDGLVNDIVTAICEDEQGHLWIGTSGGLNRLANGKFAVYTKKDGLADGFVRAIYKDKMGSLWIGTNGGGLHRVREGKFENFSTPDGLSSDFVRAFCEDREGSLWIGTYGGGLNRMCEGKFTSFSTREGLSNDMVWSVYEDKKGKLWFGANRGLSCMKDGKITIYSTQDGVPPYVITALRDDRAGNLWIGTEGGGLVRFQEKVLAVYTTQHGLSNNFVRSIYEDHKGNLWVATDQGLNLFKDGKFAVYTTKDGLSNDELSCLYEDKAGNLWIGTRTGGLNRFRDGQFTVYTAKDGLASDLIRSLYEDEDGTLWIGNNGGLNRYKDGKFTRYTVNEGLFDDLVFQILEDGKGNLWMSCNKGIYCVSKQELNDFAEGKINSITSISYGKADGMKASECNGALSQPAGWKTRDGKLWFPTIKGAVTIDPDNIKRNPLPPPVVIEQAIIDRYPLNTIKGKLSLPPENKNFEFHYAGLSFLAPQKVRFKYKLEGYDEEWVEAGTRRTAYYTHIPPGDYTFRVIASNNDGVWNETGAALAFYLKPFFYQTKLFYFLCLVAFVLTGASAYRWRERQVRSREAREALRRANEELETRVQARTSDLMRANEALRQSEEQIRRLNEKLEQRVLERTAELRATNVALEREIAERKSAQEELQYRVELEQFVAAISTHFINLTLAQIDDAINWALKKLGELTGVDRSYVFQFHEDGKAMDNTHEWCAAGVEPQIQFLQNQEIAPFPWAAERMARDEVINISRVSELPEEASAEKAMFQAQGIQSVMNIPMVYGEKLIGLIGFDAVRNERFWTDELVASLRIVGEIFANALERKRAEKALQESEARLLQLAENINEVLWMESVDTNLLIYVSPVYEKVWGRSRESLLAQPSTFIDYVHLDDREKFKAHLGKQRHGQISEMEYRITLPDGSVRWIWDRGFPIRNGDGHVYRSAGISEDVTERKQAEEARRESEERFHKAFEHAPIGMVMTATDGRFLQVNRRVCEMLGYAEAELLELTFQNVTHPDDQQPSAGFMHKLLAGEIQSAQFDKRYLHKHGQVVWAHVSVSVLRDLQGRPLYFVTQIQDFTERKRLEEQLQQYTEGLEKLVEERTARIQELERQRAESEKLATTGRMAARIAHEINNPLAGIKNSFLLLKDAIPSAHQHYEYVGRIEREIDRIARIIRQMFDLYRQEQNEVRRFRADDAIHDVVALLEPSFREHGVTGEIDAGNAASVVALPEGLLRQVLFNLIQNAIEASPAGGVVKVAAAVAGNAINISIADQGPGIPEEVHSRIFEPFFTTKSKLTTGGLGLGLSISKSLVESMRGTLVFATQIGAGTIFKITLPLGG